MNEIDAILEMVAMLEKTALTAGPLKMQDASALAAEVKRLRQERDQAVGEMRTMMGLLKELEWTTARCEQGEPAYCPSCRRYEPLHAKDCRLAEAIAG